MYTYPIKTLFLEKPEHHLLKKVLKRILKKKKK